MRARTWCQNDGGQLVPVLAVILVLAGGACIFVANLGIRLIDRARAQTSADAAALAGAVEGRSGANGLAGANTGEVTSFATDGSVAEVTVQVAGIEARATAQASSPNRSFGGRGDAVGGDREGLAPVMLAALARADELLGRPVPVVSGFRSHAEQQSLWARRDQNPFPVAAPGTSPHEQGMAVDVPRDFVALLLSVREQVGLCQPLPIADPIHFEPCLPISRS